MFCLIGLAAKGIYESIDTFHQNSIGRVCVISCVWKLSVSESVDT
jgi:hypothetical protein